MDHDHTTSPEPPAQDAVETPGQSELALRIWRRYGDSPGVTHTSPLLARINRTLDLTTSRLPLLESIQRRWTPAESAATRETLPLVEADPYFATPGRDTTPSPGRGISSDATNTGVIAAAGSPALPIVRASRQAQAPDTAAPIIAIQRQVMPFASETYGHPSITSVQTQALQRFTLPESTAPAHRADSPASPRKIMPDSSSNSQAPDDMQLVRVLHPRERAMPPMVEPQRLARSVDNSSLPVVSPTRPLPPPRLASGLPVVSPLPARSHQEAVIQRTPVPDAYRAGSPTAQPVMRSEALLQRALDPGVSIERPPARPSESMPMSQPRPDSGYGPEAPLVLPPVQLRSEPMVARQENTSVPQAQPQILQRQAGPVTSPEEIEEGPDEDELAERVMRKFMRRIAIENERRGWSR